MKANLYEEINKSAKSQAKTQKNFRKKLLKKVSDLYQSQETLDSKLGLLTDKIEFQATEHDALKQNVEGHHQSLNQSFTESRESREKIIDLGEDWKNDF